MMKAFVFWGLSSHLNCPFCVKTHYLRNILREFWSELVQHGRKLSFFFFIFIIHFGQKSGYTLDSQQSLCARFEKRQQNKRQQYIYRKILLAC